MNPDYKSKIERLIDEKKIILERKIYKTKRNIHKIIVNGNFKQI